MADSATSGWPHHGSSSLTPNHHIDFAERILAQRRRHTVGVDDVLGNLHLLIGNWLEEHPIGRVFFAPLDVVFSHFDVVEPDLLYLSNERAAQAIRPMHVRGVPELVVEIASKGTRKLDETSFSASADSRARDVRSETVVIAKLE